MLQPSVQPGSTLDHERPREEVTVVFGAGAPFELKRDKDQITATKINANGFEAKFTIRPEPEKWQSVEVILETGKLFSLSPLRGEGRGEGLRVAWHTKADERLRPLPLRRILLPWVRRVFEKPSETKEIPGLAGGNWLRGKHLFSNDRTACSRCHEIRGEGGKVGPDLSNLVHRDYASVLRDILQPNAAINPDHVTYQAELRDGDIVSGVLQSESEEKVVLAEATGKSTVIPKKQIAVFKPSTLSLMPEGLDKALQPEELKDLLTFLLTNPLEPAPLEIKGEPVARSTAELAQFSASSLSSNARLERHEERAGVRSQLSGRPLKILLASGPKDHGPGEHDYPLWQRRWKQLLALAENVSVRTNSGWPSTNDFADSDVIVFYSNNPGWSAERGAEFDSYLDRGGGAVFIHYAVDGHKHVRELSDRIGLAWQGGRSRFRHGPLDLRFTAHPLAVGFSNLHLVDESYWNLVGDEKNIEIIASGIEDGVSKPLIWTRQQGKGRIFVSIPGHYTWTFDDPLFRLLLLRGICWAAHEPMDRLAELATIGARVQAEKALASSSP
jgi:putative heme-binding domain-containing protein